MKASYIPFHALLAVATLTLVSSVSGAASDAARSCPQQLEQDCLLPVRRDGESRGAAGGAALAVLGVYLMPPLDAGPRVSLQVVPSAQGVALVGVLP